MSRLTKIRSQLSTQVFNNTKLGYSVTYYPVDSTTTNARGDETVTYGAGVTVSALDWDYFSYREDHQMFGKVEESDLTIVFPYDSGVAKKGKVTFEGEDYEVVEVERPGFGAGDGSRGAVVIIGQLRPLLS